MRHLCCCKLKSVEDSSVVHRALQSVDTTELATSLPIVMGIPTKPGSLEL